MVTQFHMTGWPEHGRPASTGSVLELLDMTTRAQMNSGNRPITVICKSDSIANTTVVYIFLCVCHLYNNLSVHLFYFSLYLSSKLFIHIYHSLHFPNSPSLIGSLPLSPLSSDGVGRTGTFICLHSQLERLKTEGVVDVLQAVKSARIQRAGLVRSAVCSFFCLSFSITLLCL